MKKRRAESELATGSQIRYFSRYSKMELASLVLAEVEKLRSLPRGPSHEDVCWAPLSPPPAQLREVYRTRESRTSTLLRQALELCRRDGSTVSLRALERASKGVDPEGRGITRRAILGNARAYAAYLKAVGRAAVPRPVQSRELDRVTKPELIHQLVRMREVRREATAALVTRGLEDWRQWLAEKKLDVLVTHR